MAAGGSAGGDGWLHTRSTDFHYIFDGKQLLFSIFSLLQQNIRSRAFSIVAPKSGVFSLKCRFFINEKDIFAANQVYS